MAFLASTFKTNLAASGGGARPGLYNVQINFGTASTAPLSFNSTETLLVKAAAIPASTIAPLAVNYSGRAYKWQGFRTFDIWNVTVINDESFSSRNKMMEWMRYLSGQMDGSRGAVYGDPSKSTGGYFDGQAKVTQVGVDGATAGVKTYTLSNLWPTELGEISVDWASDAMEEYTIGFAYDHFV
jgi:hypothetical protein